MTPRHTSPVFSFLALTSMLAAACGDDDPSGPIPAADAGIDASAETNASESRPVSSQALESREPPPSECTAIATVCEGKDDADGLGNLCLRVGASGNAEECASVVHECDSFCSDGQPPSLDGGGPNEELCKEMGNTCHDFDEGSGLGHLCHEVGHTGNVTWCGAIFDECVSLCGEPAAHHDSEDASDSGDSQLLTIRFGAKVGGRAFACGEQYSDFGSANSVVTPQDLRFYVSGLRLIKSSGEQVPVVIDDLAPFQGGGVALLDFEDGSGECRNGSAVTNTAVQVTAPAGEYTGIAFSTSVPKDLNHGDPLTLPSPLQAGDMTWGWLFGYKFIKAEFVQVLSAADAGLVVTDAADVAAPDAALPGMDAGEPAMDGDAIAPMMAGVGIFHLGSTGCTNLVGQDASANEFDVECSKPAFNNIVLDEFDPASSVVTFDLAQVFADTDLSTMSMCHGSGETCPSLFAAVGVDFETGAGLATAAAFGVE